MSESLEQILADTREEAAILERNGASFSVARVRDLCASVEQAAEGWLVWLSETNAAIQCGYSVSWLRARYPQWEREGHARTIGQARQYRKCIVPRRANVDLAAQRGREAARAVRDDDSRKSA